MISAVVFTPDTWTGDDLAHEHEVVVRSLIWLVSAVVSSVVRDVTLAVPAGLGLGEVADQSGCALTQAETESERLTAAIAAAREPRVLVLRAGFQPEAAIIQELDVLVRLQPPREAAALLAAPVTFLQRLFPGRTPVVGVLVTREAAQSVRGFGRLVALARRGSVLQARARPIL